MALSALKIKSWPFAGRIALREQAQGSVEFHVLDHWAYVGTARSEEELAALASRAPAGGSTIAQVALAGSAVSFDADVYKILVRYFSHHSKLDWHELREPTLST